LPDPRASTFSRACDRKAPHDDESELPSRNCVHGLTIVRIKALSPDPSQSRGARRRPQLLATPGPCPVESTEDPLLRLRTGRRAGRTAGGTGRQAHRTSAGSALPVVSELR
jgi:hypothetical protein